MAIAIYIRLQLQETPIFQDIKAKGQMAANPWKEAFLTANMKFVAIASIVVIGEGVVWYSGQFWALYYLQQVSKKLDPLTTAIIVGTGLVLATPTLILFGWLSDQIGRKPVILAGFLLAALTYYPLYSWLGTVTKPGAVNYPVAVFIVFILVSYVGMVYGPIGALVSTSPVASCYTSVSVPYHIGNGWGGGLVPFITSAAFAATGSLGNALVYPIAVPAVCFVLALFLMPETRHISIWNPERASAATRIMNGKPALGGLFHGVATPYGAEFHRITCYNPRSFPQGQVAQLVEQRTENPCVGGSIPPLATISAHKR